jgi:hypothetical protein
MRVPKTIQRFADERNLDVFPVTYTFQGIRLRRKGWDLCEKRNVKVIGTSEDIQYIYFTFEPVNFSDGTKWFLNNVPRNYPDGGQRYYKRLSKNMLKHFDLVWMRSYSCRTIKK